MTKKMGAGRKALPPISRVLAGRVRAHEERARRIFGVTRRSFSAMRAGKAWNEQRIANVLKPDRRSSGGMAQRNAVAVVELVSWPDPRTAWPRSYLGPLPTPDDLETFLRDSASLLDEIVGPSYETPAATLPEGTGAALAPWLSRLLAAIVIRRLADPDASARVGRVRQRDGGLTYAGVAPGSVASPSRRKPPRGCDRLAADLEAALRHYLSLYEPEKGGTTVRAVIKQRLKFNPPKPESLRQGRERALRRRLAGLKARG